MTGKTLISLFFFSNACSLVFTEKNDSDEMNGKATDSSSGNDTSGVNDCNVLEDAIPCGDSQGNGIDQMVVIVDNLDTDLVTTSGTWKSAGAASMHYRGQSSFADIENRSFDTFRFTPNLPSSSRYKVFAWNSEFNNRNTKVPHLIQYSSENSTVTVDQDSDTGKFGQWECLGTFHFEKGTNGYVEISNNNLTEADGRYIGADAVCFMKID